MGITRGVSNIILNTFYTISWPRRIVNRAQCVMGRSPRISVLSQHQASTRHCLDCRAAAVRRRLFCIVAYGSCHAQLSAYS